MAGQKRALLAKEGVTETKYAVAAVAVKGDEQTGAARRR